MQRLFDIKTTQLEMVRDRGYDISPEENILTMSLDDFIKYIRGIIAATNTSLRASLNRMYGSVDGSGRTMLVYYSNKPTLKEKIISIDDINSFIALINTYGIHEAIIIADAPLDPAGNNKLKSLTQTQWQVFQDSDLTYNPTKHVDTPRHELLSPENAIIKLRQMRTDVSKVLIIKIDDPIVRYYGWQVGGLVVIYRDDSEINILAPKYLNYRVIVG